MSINKKILFCGRKGDIYSIKAYNFLKKKFTSVIPVWSKQSSKKISINSKIKNIDILVSFRSYIIFTEEQLRKIKFLCINFHPGPPEYRGFGCANYAIYNKENFYGVTTHLINEKIDNGKIINVKKFRLKKNITLQSLLKKTHQTLLDQLKNFFLDLEKKGFDKDQINKKIYNKYKWSKKLGTKKQLDKFYKIEKKISLKELKLKIRATKIGQYKPYRIINKKKYYVE